MSTENNGSPTPAVAPLPVVNEEDVAREASRLIAAAAAKHGLATSEIPQDVKDRAHAEARVLLESRAKHVTDPYVEMYAQAMRRAEVAEAQVAALRNQHGRPEAHIIVDTVEKVRARVGELGWAKMSKEQRLASIGVAPASVNPAELQSLFGRASDHKKASDLMRADQRKYKILKEAAKVLGIF
jgi:predicted small metal-binding protein